MSIIDIILFLFYIICIIFVWHYIVIKWGLPDFLLLKNSVSFWLAKLKMSRLISAWSNLSNLSNLRIVSAISSKNVIKSFSSFQHFTRISRWNTGRKWSSKFRSWCSTGICFLFSCCQQKLQMTHGMQQLIHLFQWLTHQRTLQILLEEYLLRYLLYLECSPKEIPSHLQIAIFEFSWQLAQF